MSTARSPIRSIVRATTTIRRPHSRSVGLGHDVDEPLDEAAVGAVDQLVELDEALGAGEVPPAEGVERDAQHLLGPLAHLRQHLDEGRVGLGVGDELRQLRDGDAAVGAPLEQEVDVEHREQQPQVARDRRLQGEQRLDLVLDAEEVAVDLVVEGDHLVGELDVPLLERAHRAADGAERRAAPIFLELGLDLLELGVDRHREPGY